MARDWFAEKAPYLQMPSMQAHMLYQHELKLRL
jgi:hypothetical protein